MNSTSPIAVPMTKIRKVISYSNVRLMGTDPITLPF